MHKNYFPVRFLPGYALVIGILFAASSAFSQNCPGLGSLEINLWSQPLPTILGPSATCSGSNVNLTVKDTFAHYLWSTGATTKTISIAMPGDYSVTVTNPGGCTGTSSIHLQANNSPVPVITGVVDTCLGKAILSVGTGFAAVLWSNSSTTQSITVSDSSTYSVTVTDSLGCKGTSTYTASIIPLSAVSIAGDTSLCGGAPLNLSALLSDTTATYMWSTGQTGISITVTTGGTYSVTATKSNGCISTDTLKIKDVFFIPPSIAGPAAMCDTTSILLSVSNSYATYLWNTGADTSEIVTNLSGIYSVTVTDFNGCTGTSSFTLSNAPPPSPVITAAPYACDGTLSLQAGNYTAYQWSNNANGSVLTVDSSGTYAVTVTSAQGCTGTGSFVADIPLLPTVAISSLPSICQGSNASLSVPPGFSQYAWSNGANSAMVSIDSGGLYTVTVTDAIGCTATDTSIVENLLPPVAQISGLNQICISGTATFSVPGSFDLYAWSTGAGTPSITVNTAGVYTVTVTAANGCTASDTHTLATATNLQPQIQESPYTCNGQIDLDAGTGFTMYQWSTGQTVQSISVNLPGSYSVTVGDGTGCTGTAVTAITIPAAPSVAITGNSMFCTGTAVNLSASPNFAQYAWSSGELSSTIQVTAENTYTVTVTDQLGCTATNSVFIQALPNPSAGISQLPYTCNGQIDLDAGAGFSLYQWSTGQTVQSIAVNLSSSYSVTVTDGNGCTGSAVTAITIPAAPSVAITGNSMFCTGTAVNLSASPNFAQYAWSSGELSPTIQVTAENTYTVTVTDQLGCTATNSASVQALPNPSTGISQLPYACDGQLVLSADAGFTQYDWSGPGGFTAAGDQVSVDMSGSYQVVVTDAQGCTGMAAIMAAIPVQTPVGLSGPAQVCPGETVNMAANAGFGTYLWNTGSTQQSITVSTAGTFTVTATDALGCTSSASSAVGLFPAPVPLIAGPTSVCAGAMATLSVGNTFSSILWSTGEVSANIVVTPPLSVSVTVTDGNGCNGTASSQVAVSTPPSLSIAGNPSICPGQSNDLTASGGFTSYIWSSGATTSGITVNQPNTYLVTATDAFGCTATSSFVLNLAPPLSPSIVQQPYQCDQQRTLSAGNGFDSYLWSNGSTGQSIQVAQSGAYTVTVTNALGCSGTAFILADIPASPFVQVDGLHNLCSGGSTLLTASGNALTYTWSNGTTGAAITITQAGTYSVVATDAYGCTVLENHIVDLAPPIVSTLTRTTCRITDAGTQVFTFTAANGCDSVQTIVTTYEPTVPGYALVMDTQIDADLGQQIQINVGANFVIDSVSFHSPFSLSCTDCLNPTLVALDSGFILVEAFDPEGCFTTGEIRISLNRSVNIYVPNVFHPGSNENGFLDVFSGSGIQEVRNFHVFDRWGNALFARETMPTNTPGSGWDGTFRNQSMMPGVYVYYFEVLLPDGSIVKHKGDVTIVK